MAGIIFDTSVYIAALRSGDLSRIAQPRATRAGEQKTRPLWLSAVVLEELYAGANNPATLKLCAKMEHDFAKAQRKIA